MPRSNSEIPADGQVFRIGSVPFLNSVPLTRGIEHGTLFLPPSELAVELRQGRLDAGLVSVTEVLFNDLYDVLDGVAVASRGAVKSVFLAHIPPLEKIRTIQCDPASLTSVNLLKVLLQDLGLSPELAPLENYADAEKKEAVLLIGNQGIEFLSRGHPHQIWDLGNAWTRMTGLPFVFAVWAIRRDVNGREQLCRKLRNARDTGLEDLAETIKTHPDFDEAFRSGYLGGHIRYELNAAEKEGLAMFVELLGPICKSPIFLPRFIET